ncbi:MAG: hypothetical protein LWX11_03880, partial [Firmicutes bacterium]|nr:hypothetical protein [Bacillota bacterium]
PSEIFQLWAECREAKCGLLWEAEEAAELTAWELEQLPPSLFLHLPWTEIQARPGFWEPFASRLALWGLATPQQAENLGLTPAILIVDGI